AHRRAGGDDARGRRGRADDERLPGQGDARARHRAMSAPLRAGMVAGEASGDLLAGLLLQGMRQRWPQLQAQGIGGPQMARQGFEAWWPHEKLAVSGYVEVLRHYREIVGIRGALRDRLLADPPQA